jgi:TRAP-type C4-dicarboxylate transport system permease small subunit
VPRPDNATPSDIAGSRATERSRAAVRCADVSQQRFRNGSSVYLRVDVPPRSLGGVMRRVVRTVLAVVCFVVACIVFGSIMVRLFKATGNWDTEGAEIGIYPGLISIGLALVATRTLLRLTDRRRA